MAPKAEQPFGIRLLMWLCLFGSISALVDLVSWGHPLYVPGYPFPEAAAQHAISIVIGLSGAPLFYGIRRRLAVAWKFGWVILIADFSLSIVEVLASIKQLPPQSGGWTLAAVATIMISAVAIYWSRWWNRQKNYFIQPGL